MARAHAHAADQAARARKDGQVAQPTSVDALAALAAGIDAAEAASRVRPSTDLTKLSAPADKMARASAELDGGRA